METIKNKFKRGDFVRITRTDNGWYQTTCAKVQIVVWNEKRQEWWYGCKSENGHPVNGWEKEIEFSNYNFDKKRN